MSWHNLRVRGDLYELIQARAKQESRSVASMADVLLTRALESVLGSPDVGVGTPEDASGTVAPAPTRASGSDRSEGRASTRTASQREPSPAQLDGQTTVEEMLASCPNCAETLSPAEGRPDVLVCGDCGYVREP